MRQSQIYEQELDRYMSGPIPWEKLVGKTILVAGANGMIGAALIRLLLHRNHSYGAGIRILAISRNREYFLEQFSGTFQEEELQYVSADICEKIPVEERADFIVHAAGDGDPASFAGHPVEVMKANLAGLDQILRYAIEKKADRVLYISSGEVYGQSVEGQVFDEAFSGYVDHASPRSCYPAAKRAAEVLCQSYILEYGLDIVIARPCHIFGPDMKPSDSRAVSSFLRCAVLGQDLVMKSSGTQQRSLCWAPDCAEALLLILLKGENREAYNIAGANQVLSIRQLAELICREGQVRLRVEEPTSAEKNSYNRVEKSVLDWHKIYSLGWRPRADLAEGMKKTIEIMKEKAG